MVGQTITHYRILEKLGEGAMGVVYKAEDLRLRRVVAMKFLAPGLVGREESRARFEREAQAAGKLDHPNICAVFDFGESDGHNFMVMSYVEGSPLNVRLKERGVTTAEALDLAIQIGEGLVAAHRSGVVHRDIKCANVMVSRDGVARITDFGLALLTDRSRLTKAGSLMGTVAYMSPEQALGKDVDHRSDLWALGVVLYEMLAGRRPFDDARLHRILSLIVSQEPASIARAGSSFWVEMDRILRKALAKDPRDRYQHADDFVVDLRAAARLTGTTFAKAAAAGGSRRSVATQTATLTMPAAGETRGSVAAPRSRKIVWMAAAGALVLVVLALLWWKLLTP